MFGVDEMKEWFKDLDTVKKLAIKCLKEFPHTRDSDMELFYMILKAVSYTHLTLPTT